MPEKPITAEASVPIETVWMNYRYVSAWSEVNARIAQRQNAVNIFVTLSTAIVTVLLTSRRTEMPLDPNLFSLLIPVVSLVFGFLNYKHDKTIALLRDYMAECETHNSNELKLLAYNSSKKYRKYADEARSFHDYSCAGLIVIFNGLGVYVAYQTYPDVFRLTGYPVLVYLVVAVISVGLVIRSTVRPHVFR